MTMPVTPLPEGMQPTATPATPPPAPQPTPKFEAPQDKAINIVRANPSLSNHPDAVMALSEVPQADGATLGQASHGMGWLSRFGTFLSGFGHGTEQILGGAYNLVNDQLTASTESLTQGFIGGHGFNRQANLQQMNQIDAPLQAAVRHPVSFMTAKMSMLAHYGSFMNTLANQHGTAYAAGWALPQFIAAVLGDGVLNGVGEAGAASGMTADVGTLARLNAKLDNGTGLTLDEGSQMAAARARILRAQNVTETQAASKIAADEQLANTRRLFRGAAAVAEKSKLGSPIGLARKGLGMVTKSGGNFRLNALMYLNEMAASSNPEMKRIWDLTSNLQVYDKYGRATGTLGQSLADALGLKHDAFLRSAVSGTTDLYTKYLATDPFQAIGGLTKAARSAAGMRGMLGRLWGGIGVESGADVIRTWDKSSQSVNAYHYLATHGSTDIQRAFPDIPEAVRNALGRAKSIPEVVNIMADVADAGAMTRSIQPTMGAIKFSRAVLRDGMTVGSKMGEDVKTLEADAAEIKNLTGVDVFPKGVAEAVGDAGVRTDTSLARRAANRLAGLFKQVPMHIMKQPDGTLKIETKTYYAGQKSAIPSIGNQLRQIGRGTELQARIVEDFMQHAPGADEMQRVVDEGTTALVTSAIASVAPEASQMMLRDAMKSFVQRELRGMQAYAAEGGSEEAGYMNGPWASETEQLVHPRGPQYGLGRFGFGRLHQGRWSFLDPREVRNMIDGAQKALQSYSDWFQGSFTKLEDLQAKSLEQAAKFKNATLSGLDKAVSDMQKLGQASMDKYDTTAGSAYTATHEQMAAYTRNVYNDPTLTDFQKYIKVFKQVSFESKALEKRIATYSEDIPAVLADPGINRTTALFDHGALQAIRDYQAELSKRIIEPGILIKDTRKWALKQAENLTAITKTRKEISDKLFHDMMEHKLYKNGHGFLNRGNVIVDRLNRILSKSFVPMALSTGGFIFRITGSEAMLNVFRMGLRNYSGAMLDRSIAKNVFRAQDLAVSEHIAQVQQDVAAEFEKARLAEEQGQIWHEGTPRPNEPTYESGAKMATPVGAQPEPYVHPFEVSNGDVAAQMERRMNNIEQGMSEHGLIKRTVSGALHNLAQAVEGVDALPAAIREGMSKVAIKRFQQNVADMFYGTLTGIERGALSSMDDATFQRLLDNATSYTMRHGGHIPNMGHGGSSSGQFDAEQYSTSIDRASGISKTKDGTLKVVEKNAKRGEFYTQAKPEHLATAHVENLNRIFNDPLLHPSMVDLQKEIAIHGEKAWRTPDQMDKLVERLMLKQYDRIAHMTPDEMSGMQNAIWPMESPVYSSKLGAKMDWAKRIALNSVGSVVGYAKGGEAATEYVLHKVLVDQAVSGVIDSPVEMAARLAKMGTAAPKHIVARSFDDYGLIKGPLKSLASSNFFREINRLGVDRVMGPIMSWVSREPVSVWEYHLAMEAMRPQIEKGIISEVEAEVMADQQALARLARFVHNPADRLQFEANTRIYAPFYFAQNQAMRRASRVAAEDFGAFDRYLKASLAVTHYVVQHTLKGALAAVSFPASQYITNFFVDAALNTVGLFTNNVTPLEKSILGSISMGLNMDASSVQTIAPTGPEQGWAMFANAFRPSSGPFVDIPLKAIHYGVDFGWYNRFLTDVLGKIGASSGITTGFVPSAADRALLASTFDAINIASSGWGNTNAVLAGVQVKAMHSALDNLMTKYIQEFMTSKYASTAQFLGDPNLGESGQQQMVTKARVYADRKIIAYLAPGTQTRQQFVEDTHIAALALYLAKTFVGLAGPASVSLHTLFTHDQLYQKISTTKNPDGTLPSLTQSMTEFATQDPAHFLDLVSSSQTPRGALPEDTNFQQWAQKAPNIVESIPTLLSYTISRNGQYVPSMYTVQHTMGLRTMDTPQQYITAIDVALGNDVWYNSVEPSVYAKLGLPYYVPGNPNNPYNSQVTKELSSAALGLGMNNPDWLAASSYGSNHLVKKSDAILDLRKFATTPSMQADVYQKGLISAQDVTNLVTLHNMYSKYIPPIHYDIANGINPAGDKEALWQAFNALLTNPTYKNQHYLIRSVLMTAPTSNQ